MIVLDMTFAGDPSARIYAGDGSHVFLPDTGEPEPLVDVPEDDEPDVRLPGGLTPHVYTARIVDEHGREWRVIDHDAAAVERLVAEHDAREKLKPRVDDVGPDLSFLDAATLDTGAPMAMMSGNWDVYDCGFSDKWVYLPTARGDLDDPTYAGTAERVPVADGNGVGGSMVLLAPNLVMTAGHVSPNFGANDPDPDEICIRDGVGEACSEIINSYLVDDEGCTDDWQILKLASDLPTTFTYDLSSGQDDFLDDQTPRHSGYPTIRLFEEATCGTNSLLEGEKNFATYHSILTKQIKLNVTTGGNASGGPYYFYNSGSGRFKLIGVHRGRGETLGDKWACGPKVPYWRLDIIAAAAAMGVAL